MVKEKDNHLTLIAGRKQQLAMARTFLDKARITLGLTAPEFYRCLGWTRQRYHKAIGQGGSVRYLPLVLEALPAFSEALDKSEEYLKYEILRLL